MGAADTGDVHVVKVGPVLLVLQGVSRHRNRAKPAEGLAYQRQPRPRRRERGRQRRLVQRVSGQLQLPPHHPVLNVVRVGVRKLALQDHLRTLIQRLPALSRGQHTLQIPQLRAEVRYGASLDIQIDRNRSRLPSHAPQPPARVDRAGRRWRYLQGQCRVVIGPE